MNARSMKILGVVVIVLFGILFALNSGERRQSPPGEALLFPELKSRLNDINRVTLTDAAGQVALERRPDGSASSAGASWVSPEYGGYPVDTPKLRQLLLAIADARKLERKTSDPALYDRLGVQDPSQDGGAGVLITARGDNAAVSLILGAPAQQDFRYARIPEESASWLINQNPEIPEDSAGWLLPGIVDIDPSRVASVVVRHPDDEVIALVKENADAVNFEVTDIPAGRELRYPSIANSIAGVPGNLTFEDVRRIDDLPIDDDTDDGTDNVTRAEFRTFDGLEVLVSVHPSNGGDEANNDGEDDSEDNGGDAGTPNHWVTFKASAEGTAAAAPENDTANPATADAEAAPDEPNVDAEAAKINARVAGWAYALPSYKIDQLTKRWEDLLNEEDDATTEN